MSRFNPVGLGGAASGAGAVLHHRARALAGAWSYTKLGRNEDPELHRQGDGGHRGLPGATADEMNRQVADPIERRLQTLPSLDYIKTYTRPGFVALQVVLKDAAPPRSVPDLRTRCARRSATSGRPALGRDRPVLQRRIFRRHIAVFTLTAPEAKEADLVTAAERVRMGLSRVTDVEKVELLGEQARRIFVDISNASWPSSASLPAGHRRCLVAPERGDAGRIPSKPPMSGCRSASPVR